jgi:hypothetical protein
MEKLPSGQVRYPSHSWGVFALDPSLDVGIAGEAWAQVVRSAWLESGGSEETVRCHIPPARRLREEAGGTVEHPIDPGCLPRFRVLAGIV